MIQQRWDDDDDDDGDDDDAGDADDDDDDLRLHTYKVLVWPGGVVVSALGMRTRRPRFESRVVPLFHWVPTLGKLFTHIASPVSQLQETGVQKGVFGA